MRRPAWGAALVLAAAAAGLSQLGGDRPAVPEETPKPFEFRVAPGFPLWKAIPIGYNAGPEAREDAGRFRILALLVVEKGSPDRVVQTLKVEQDDDVPLYWRDGWMDAADFDSDGFQDLALHKWDGSVGTAYDLYLFDPKAGRFSPSAGEFVSPSPEPRTHRMWSQWRSGACCGEDELYRFEGEDRRPVVVRDRTVDEEGARTTFSEADAQGRLRPACVFVAVSEKDKPRLVRGDRRDCPATMLDDWDTTWALRP